MSRRDEARVRPAGDGDTAFIVGLAEQAFRPFLGEPRSTTVRQTVLRRSIQRMLAQRGSLVLVAERAVGPSSEDATLRAPVGWGTERSPRVNAGFAIVALRPLARDFGPWERPSAAHLDAIAVLPEAAGTGVGRLLLAAAEARARAAGAVSMSLQTAETNTRAQRLFRTAGYTLVATFDQAYSSGQRGLAMIKGLARP